MHSGVLERVCACTLLLATSCSAVGSSGSRSATTPAPAVTPVVSPALEPVTAPTPPAAPAPVVPAPPDESELALALPPSHSTSLGAPGGGTLDGSVALPQHGPGFSFNTLRPEQARFGTVELVQTLIRAAAIVERELPGSGLVVNDLSLQSGGKIKQHSSHQSGRDVDILFFMLDASGSPVPAVGVPIDPQGEGIDFRDLVNPDDDLPERIDLPRTWAFVQAMLETSGPLVQRIFLAEHVRKLLLEQARKVGAPEQWRKRFDMLTCQPEVPHDDHMHVRFYCSAEDQTAGCIDTPPTYPWRIADLKLAGLKPRIENAADRLSRRAEVAERTTSVQEAKQKAGPMDKKVVEFLARRDHWVKKPHPGRPYCP